MHTFVPSHARIRVTPRQWSVVEQIWTGKSFKQIAYELGLSEGTIKVYLYDLRKTTGLENNIQIALAFERGGFELKDPPAARVPVHLGDQR
jgi:DNA-binding NarL/FixJ family response regulator